MSQRIRSPRNPVRFRFGIMDDLHPVAELTTSDMDKKQLSERDICTKFIKYLPAPQAGWDRMRTESACRVCS